MLYECELLLSTDKYYAMNYSDFYKYFLME